MCVETFEKDRDRTLLRNIAYAGSLAALLKIDTAVIEAMLTEKFGKKPKLLAANHTAFKLGYDYAMAHFQCPLPFHLEPMDRTGDSILIDGNTAAALGAVYAGATVGAWYPITPATALMEQFKGFCEKYRVDKETGLHKYAILQAEDELAAAGIIIGAGWAGARAFTNTSGPGISLMQEFIGLAYYTDIPAVFIDVQRCGPATGMPTRTQQADLLSLAYASHGDTKHLIVFPADPRECFEMTVQAFDLAERFQTPVFVASDLDIGMNDWMVRRFEWDDSVPPRPRQGARRGRRSRRSSGSRAISTSMATASRRAPSQASAARAPTSSAALATTSTASTPRTPTPTRNSSTASSGSSRARPSTSPPRSSRTSRAPRSGLVTIGGCEAAVREAADILRAEGIHTDYMRIRGFPFSEEVRKFLGRHEHTFVIEQNRDAQLRSLIQIELGVARDAMTPILDYSGMPLTAATVVNAVKTHLAEVPA
jgi:2-oxoglutarate ferredoxin oxidoreductase subunit alpha